MDAFLIKWAQSAHTSVGFFWMALWAFILGYVFSGIIQVFVTTKRMQSLIGGKGLKSISLGTFFGFISSSCSFSALATTKTLLQKKASFVSSLAFLLASTNLVVELGIVIVIFLGWQFVVGEYLGGLLLILLSWLLIRLIKPARLIHKARERLDKPEEDHSHDMEMTQNFTSIENWSNVGKKYAMEWKMVWKDVTIGFTVAGVIAAFVPDSFFETLFVNAGTDVHDYPFLTLLEHVVIGPVAAFCTFIGSMGNIPLAALLFSKGVSFAGVMAFIFSDLVVFPVLRINARYYGWKMSFFILFLLFTSLIGTSLLLHYGFDLMGMIPDPASVRITETTYFSVDYTFWLNVVFLIVSGVLLYLGFYKGQKAMNHAEMAPKSPVLETVLKYLALTSYAWLFTGILLKYILL